MVRALDSGPTVTCTSSSLGRNPGVPDKTVICSIRNLDQGAKDSAINEIKIKDRPQREEPAHRLHWLKSVSKFELILNVTPPTEGPVTTEKSCNGYDRDLHAADADVLPQGKSTHASSHQLKDGQKPCSPASTNEFRSALAESHAQFQSNNTHNQVGNYGPEGLEDESTVLKNTTEERRQNARKHENLKSTDPRMCFVSNKYMEDKEDSRQSDLKEAGNPQLKGTEIILLNSESSEAAHPHFKSSDVVHIRPKTSEAVHQQPKCLKEVSLQSKDSPSGEVEVHSQALADDTETRFSPRFTLRGKNPYRGAASLHNLEADKDQHEFLCNDDASKSVHVRDFAGSLVPRTEIEIGGLPSNHENTGLGRYNKQWFYEINRLKSFSHCLNLPVSTIRLAQSGFYYDKEEDNIFCFSCGLAKRNWDTENLSRVAVMHLHLSPDCDHAHFRDKRNVPISLKTSSCMRPGTSEQRRRNHEIDDGHDNAGIPGSHPHDISPDGGAATANPPAVPPVSSVPSETLRTPVSPDNKGSETSQAPLDDESTLSLPPPKPDLDRMMRHMELVAKAAGTAMPHSSSSVPRAPVEDQVFYCFTSIQAPQFLASRDNLIRFPVQVSTVGTTQQGQVTGTVCGTTSRNTGEDVNDITDDPAVLRLDMRRAASPINSKASARFASYFGWPTGTGQDPRVLALAGFYYLGSGDSVRCWFCGIILRNWRQSYDPWVTHVYFRFSCDYVIAIKGQDFVTQALLGRTKRNEEHSREFHQVTNAADTGTDEHSHPECSRDNGGQSQTSTNNTTNTVCLPSEVSPPEDMPDAVERQPSASAPEGRNSSQANLTSRSATNNSSRSSVASPALASQANFSSQAQNERKSLNAKERVSGDPRSSAFTSENQQALGSTSASTRAQTHGQKRASSAARTVLRDPRSPASDSPNSQLAQASGPAADSTGRPEENPPGDGRKGKEEKAKDANQRACGSNSKPPASESVSANVASPSSLEVDSEPNVTAADSADHDDQISAAATTHQEETNQPGNSSSAEGMTCASGATPVVTGPRQMEGEDAESYFQRLREENRRLRARRTCKMCWRNTIDTIFLPCGHLSTCDACAITIRECCFCHQRIRGTAHVYLE